VIFLKIEKVNDNQIRCTLNKSDMDEYHLKLSELAYGTDKAKALFHDMMSKANYEFGFSAEDIPLMIEAIPLSAECIVLVITKVDSPDELDTRFSRFTPSPDDEEDEGEDVVADFVESATDILELFKRISKEKAKNPDASAQQKVGKSKDDDSGFVPLAESLLSRHKKTDPADIDEDDLPFTDEAQAEIAAQNNADAQDELPDITKIYIFNDLDSLDTVSKVIADTYSGFNSLYKCPADDKYYLFVSKGNATPERFNRTCNILSEYAKQHTYTPGVKAYFDEHCELLIARQAIQRFRNL